MRNAKTCLCIKDAPPEHAPPLKRQKKGPLHCGLEFEACRGLAMVLMPADDREAP